MGVFIHPSADVQSKNIGDGTRVWQYVVILPGARIGKNCNICSHCFIENDVIIGDNVTVKPMVAICDGVTLEDGVFIGPHVSFTNDRHPKSGNREFKLERTTVRAGATVGAGSMVMAGLTVGENALVAGGSVITRDVKPETLVAGVPARSVRKIGERT